VGEVDRVHGDAARHPVADPEVFAGHPVSNASRPIDASGRSYWLIW
jgi:hypothetical protein